MKLTDAENSDDGIFFPALEQNMMGAVLINENDEVLFFNPAAEKLWGYTREEVIGNNISMLIPQDLRPAHPGAITRGMRFYAKSLRPFMTMSAVVIMCFVTVATSLLLSLPKPAKMTPCVLPSAFVAG